MREFNYKSCFCIITYLLYIDKINIIKIYAYMHVHMIMASVANSLWSKQNII